MKRLIVIILSGIICTAVLAQEKTGWLRNSSISPDGKTLVFSYQGDIFSVSVEGGTAVQLSSNPSYDSNPLWTPDGGSIVFTSFREGSRDLWIMDAKGGTPKRITTLPGNESPLCITDKGALLFSAGIQADKDYAGWYEDGQTWSTSLQGGKVSAFLPFNIRKASFNGKGDMVFENYKGYEDQFRKHHTSSVAHDIWLRTADGEFRQLSSYAGNNQDPVFAPDGNSFYFLCEKGGNLNIWKSSLSNPGEQTQVSFFETHPVRNLSISSQGVLACSYNGSLFIVKEGSEPRKVEILVSKDKNEREHTYLSATSASYYDISPNGKEVAVISRGDVYVTSEEYSTTKRITCTPVQERDICFDKDGSAIYYSSERNGEWGIYRSKLRNDKEKYFTYGTLIDEERITPEGQTCFQPIVSPDGEWLAYLRDRTDIVVRNLKSGKEKTILEAVNYSYSDGDQEFEWCPDSHHIACTYMADGGWNNSDIAVIDIESGEIHNITSSGYSNSGFHWVLKGKAITWLSDKYGYRSHGSWGSYQDIFIQFLDNDAYKKFRRDEEISKLLKEESGKEEKEEKKDSVKLEKGRRLDLDFEYLEDRTIKLTSSSGNILDHYLSDDGKKLYYTCSSTEGFGFYCLDLEKGNLRLIERGFFGGFIPSKDGQSLYMSGSRGLVKMNLSSGSTKSISVNGEFEYDAAAEREYIFEHCWKQVEEKFYDASIHGIDWKGFHDNYRQFLPYINNNFDFSEMLSEMLGELNGSHTGCRYYASTNASAGHLGVLFDMDYDGKGLRIGEVLPGSVLAREYPELEEGDIISHINGVEIPKGQPWWEALNRKNGKRILITVRKGHKDCNVYVTPSGSDNAGLYRKWVKRNEETVAALSGGKIAYVHVAGMDSQSFREVFSKALGKYRSCEALIVDTRNNGGGWLTDDLISFLSGRSYVDYTPRGRYMGSAPYDRWNKPSCVLVGENNYSDACGFPYAYKALGLGKLIGAPVPGTMTAVWWERQVDPSLVFGIPQVTCTGKKDGKPIENNQVEPDILVYNDPASLIDGKDKQLEAAVAEMLKVISAGE